LPEPLPAHPDFAATIALQMLFWKALRQFVGGIPQCCGQAIDVMISGLG
jgi:hypothetical protein